jgi:hypothetical protein
LLTNRGTDRYKYRQMNRQISIREVFATDRHILRLVGRQVDK